MNDKIEAVMKSTSRETKECETNEEQCKGKRGNFRKEKKIKPSYLFYV